MSSACKYAFIHWISSHLPELKTFFDEAFAMAAEGDQWVVLMLGGNADKNLGTTFKKSVSVSQPVNLRPG